MEHQIIEHEFHGVGTFVIELSAQLPGEDQAGPRAAVPRAGRCPHRRSLQQLIQRRVHRADHLKNRELQEVPRLSQNASLLLQQIFRLHLCRHPNVIIHACNPCHSLSDLQALKCRKSSPVHYSTSPFGHKDQKIYFIISYSVEFDKVHYPLPLNYESDPSPDCLKQTIRKLRAEVGQLKDQNEQLKQNESFQLKYSELLQQNQELQENLESSLNLSEQMKTQIEQISKENEILQSSDKKLKLRIEQLENELKASLQAKKKKTDKSFSQASVSQLNLKSPYETERQSIQQSKDISIDFQHKKRQQVSSSKRLLKSNFTKSGKSSVVHSDLQSDVGELSQKNKENGFNSSGQKSFFKKPNFEENSVNASVKNLDQRFNKLGQLLKQAKYY